ncbi:MAG: phosphatase PAP2 family protein [Rhodospirillaceae bacterium]|nr:phosphatase PAP2 family protein [Rhodospirillaceae bacterium]
MRPPLDPFAPRLLWRVAAAIFWVSVLFMLAPGIDRWVSRQLSSPETGFFWADLGVWRLVRDLVVISVAAVAVAALATLAARLLWPRRRGIMRVGTALYLVASLALVPGLLVNGVLKDNWGRPRPIHLAEFRDPPALAPDLEFQPVWVMSDQCPANCSFVSGEASAAMVLVALVPLVAPRRRRAALAAALAWGGLVSAVRVIQGGHFLSDVVLAGLLTYLAVGLLHRWLRSHPPNWLEERALVRRVAALHTFLTRPGRGSTEGREDRSVSSG